MTGEPAPQISSELQTLPQTCTHPDAVLPARVDAQTQGTSNYTVNIGLGEGTVLWGCKWFFPPA